MRRVSRLEPALFSLLRSNLPHDAARQILDLIAEA
jgi:hypothetical protein